MLYESALGWNPAKQDHNELVSGAGFLPADSAAGYTPSGGIPSFPRLPHLFLLKNTARNPVIDLSRYTSGFTKDPVFTLSQVTGGTATQGGAGGKLVQFKADNATGRGGFLFTVKDADGSLWTQQFGICVSNSVPREGGR